MCVEVLNRYVARGPFEGVDEMRYQALMCTKRERKRKRNKQRKEDYRNEEVLSSEYTSSKRVTNKREIDQSYWSIRSIKCSLSVRLVCTQPYTRNHSQDWPPVFQTFRPSQVRRGARSAADHFDLRPHQSSPNHTLLISARHESRRTFSRSKGAHIRLHLRVSSTHPRFPSTVEKNVRRDFL